MKKRIVNLLMIVAAVLIPFAGQAQGPSLVINEIMQGNIDFILEANEFPDSWVELYNPTDEDINFNGYGLGLKKKNAYYFGIDTIVPSKGFLVVYCDKEAYELHTDFRLDAGSGSVYLMTPDGSVADQLSHKKQLAPNIAYGRVEDAAAEWGWQLNPTPGLSNSCSGGVSTTLLPQPEFSVPAGLYQQGFVLTISIPEDYALPDDTRLCITTDGREPTIDDAVPSDGYGQTDVQENTDKSGESNMPGFEQDPQVNQATFEIASSTVVRAKLISSQAHSPRSTTRSYIFHPRQTSLSVVSIATNPDFLYDNIIGIFAGVLGENPNFEMDLRRPVYIEYFDAEQDYKCTINQCSEIKVQGNWSTRFPQKSFNVYAQKRFGVKRFDATNFWPDKPNVVECKSFVMRNGGSDGESGRIRDQLSQTLLGRSVPMTDWQANREVICYINGQYKGVYDLRERADDDNIAANYGGLEDIDLIDSWDDVKSGDVDFNEYIAQAGAISTFEELCVWTDIEQFINMYILEAFVCNTDFIGNNIVSWRRWDGDGRWRWILKDLDRSAVSWIDLDYDYFDFVRAFRGEDYGDLFKDTSNIFNVVIDTDEGRRFMADHMAVAMGDWLHPDYMNQVLEELCQQLEPEYLYTLQEYYPQEYGQRYEGWQKQIEFIRQWWPARMDYVYNQMLPRNCLTGTDPTPQTYTLEVNPNGNDLLLNDVRVYRPTFDGRYYNSLDMTLATSSDYNGWRLEITRKDGSVEELTIASNLCPIPSDESYLKIVAEIYDVTGIEDVIEDKDNVNTETNVNNNKVRYFNLQGVPVDHPYKGQMVIEKRGTKVRTVIF